MADDGLLSIGRAAAWLGVAPSALRYYETEGLLTPQRTDKGTRRYRPADLDRLALVRGLADLGVPLVKLRDLAESRQTSQSGDEAGRRVAALFDDLQRDLEIKMAECRRLSEQVAEARERVAACFGCDRPPTPQGCRHCPTASQLTRTAAMGLVWESEDFQGS
ncbi:MerR family transcriptional regulator [Magnetospira sp. QH-2]|uniref:MerR family transcriptional regulator n=1 Tax=Magnetospira sp. (strain QH-2) TaxID=1288970 RepID=UPI0003E81751|nr:MerR family transcriptional regulator [Magnetospira sp. QH-2]CCQ72357.1 HTH transcriptional regulator, MerR family [Magnetospira sp. QH-2]